MTISVFLADDNLLVREGVKALMELSDDIHVVGVAQDFDGLVAGAEAAEPQVVVTDIRMPPDFSREGIEAAKLVRKRHPGTGIVILSQYDDPEYAIALLSDGAAGYAYLLKDRVAESDQLVRAIREVATGGSMLDPKIVEALTRPVTSDGLLDEGEERLLDMVAEGTPIKAIALALSTTPADADSRIEKMFLKLAQGLSGGDSTALERLRTLQRAIADREEQGEELSRLLPGGLAEKLRRDGRRIGETEELEVTVLMSDIRGYSGIAERTDPTTLAGQLNRHRAEMNRAIIAHGGTVMQFVGDAVMAVFGAPDPMVDHAERATEAAVAMHEAQDRVNTEWADEGLEAFGLGIGVSTGPVAAALLGSEERIEYSVVGDTVNLTQRLQQWGDPGETVLSEATFAALASAPDCEILEPAAVKGRVAPVAAFRFPEETGMTASTSRVVLRAIVVTSIVLALASFATMLVRHGVGRLADSDVPTVLVIASGLGAVVLVAADQQPRNRLLWVLTAFVASTAWFALGTTARTIVAPEVPFRLTVDAVVPADLPRAAAWLEYGILPLASFGSALLLTFGLLLFPDGKLPSRTWRPIGFVAAAALGIGFIRNLIVWHPSSSYVINEHPLFHLLSPVDFILPLVALAAVVMRFRRADADDRRRFKWIVWGMALFVPLTLFGWMSGLTIAAALANLVFIASFGIAITRHHLFDVDLVISRTLVFGSLAVFIGVVYVGVVVGVGSLIGSGDEPNAVLSVGATALVAVGFQPVRRRLERVANRLVFGRRATPYEVLSEFSRRVAATSNDLLDDAARSLAEGTRAERVVISVMVGGEALEAAAWPEVAAASAEPVSFPITDTYTTLGSLDLYLPAGQQLQDDDRRLAEQLASGMGLALRNQLLTERLEARVEELRESRRRLVALQDETRRRLERDLHDGAQQQLVALKVKLGLGRAIAEKDGAARTAELLGRLSGEADQAVDAMREFARGVYPPLLEAEGLASAIAAQARRAPIPVTVDSDGIGRYPREIESTVYFCVLEALRNTVQHAGASQATVSLTRSNGSLEFQVTDDGAGFEQGTDRGVGLTAMADRLDALTGDLHIHTEPGNGTSLIGTIPVPAEVPA